MSTSTATPQQAAILIEEGSLETGKRKFTKTSKTDKETIIELLNEVLQQKLREIVHENASKYTKDEFVSFLEKRINCPKGTMEMVAQLAKQRHGVDRTARQINKTLERTTKSTWQMIKKNYYEKLYNEFKDNASTTKSTTATTTKFSKNDNNDEDKIDDKNKCTSSIIGINSILREDVSHEHVQKAIRQIAAHTTTAVSNVSVLVRMTLCKLAQHQITIKNDNAQLKKERTGFQMSKIFPASFTVRDKRPMDVNGKVMIATSNISLKENLEKVYKPKTGASDLQSLFSDNHLQYIQSHHLGDKKNSTNDPNHPFWHDLTFKNCNLPSVPQGISTTIASGIKEFSTNFKNMWDGTTIYKRVERKVIRVLLRLHLAPTREATYMERVKKAKQAASKKMLGINKTQQSDDMGQPSKTLSRKQIKSKIQHERHQIKRHQKKAQSDESNKEKYHRRIHSCENRIHKLESLMKNTDQRDESNIYPNDKERSTTPEIPKSAVHDVRTLGVGDIIEKWEKEAEEAEETEREKDEVKRKAQDVTGTTGSKKVEKATDKQQQQPKDTSAGRIRVLEGVIKALLKSKKIDHAGNLTDEQILKTSHNKSLKANEVETIKLITNQLLPYTPGSESMCLLTQLPFIMLGNAILMAAGYNDYVQDISPDVPPHKIHTIAINPAIIYETLTPHEYGIPQGPFQVTPVGSSEPITSSSAARKDGDAMWWSFFDHTKVKRLCDMHKMVFANRMVIRPDKTVSLLGTIKNNHTPIISEYEKRQKKKRKSKKSSYVNILPHLAGKSKSQLEQDLQSVEGSITELQTTQIELKKQSGQATKAWQATKDELKKSSGKVKQLLSKKLKDDVQEKRKANSLLKLSQRKIKDFRSMKYQLNKAISHCGKNDPLSSVPPTTPTPTRIQHEDISANIDVSKLDMNKCVYGATDYGHVVLSQTVPLTNNDIRFHVDLYNKQQQYQKQQLQIIDNMQDTEKMEQDVVEKQQPDMKHDVSDEKSKSQDLQQRHEQFEEMHCNWVIHSSHEVDFTSLTDDALKNDQLEKLQIMLDNEIKFMKTAFSVEDLKLPKPFSITNEQVHEESFARKFARRREKRKKRKKNKKVVLAEEQLKSCSFTGIIDPDELLRRQKVRLSVKNVLREFYYCPAAMNEHRHQYVSSHNIYVKLARKEREYVKKSCAAKLPYHRKQLKVMMLIGLAGMGFNTFLKGRPRRGGKRFRKAHRTSTTVALQNEHMSSQICVFCFQPLSLLPATILKDGKKQKKHSHGALTCNNSNCPAVLAGYTTFNRDAVGATGIGLAAVTTIFSSDKKPLPPYNPSASTTTTGHFELDQIYRLVSPSSTFLHGAGQTSM